MKKKRKGKRKRKRERRNRKRKERKTTYPHYGLDVFIVNLLGWPSLLLLASGLLQLLFSFLFLFFSRPSDAIFFLSPDIDGPIGFNSLELVFANQLLQFQDPILFVLGRLGRYQKASGFTFGLLDMLKLEGVGPVLGKDIYQPCLM